MTDVAIDQGDNVYLLGNFTTSVDFGLGALNSVDENDLFLVRLTSGQASWSMRIGSTFVDTAESIAASPANEVAVAASWQDALSIGTTNLSGTQQARNAVVAKVTGVNPMNATWNQVSSGAFGQSRTVKTMAADPSGNLAFVIRGTSQTGGFTISYDGASETSNNGAPLAVLFRATSSGAYSWHKRLDGQSNVTVDTFSNGDVLICGSYTGAGDFASGFTLPAASGRDVWVARFSAIGQRVWDRRYGGPGQDGQNGADAACAVTPDGGYVVAFWSDDAVDLGGTMVPGTAASVVVGEFGDDGMNLWNRRSTGDASVRSVDAGAQSVALLLSYDTSVGFDTASSTAGMNDVHVTRFSR